MKSIVYITLTVLALMFVWSTDALADDCTVKVEKRLKRLHKTAMEDYDQMEFTSARKTLQDAISIARREGCDASLEYANILVDLGIIYITDTDNPDENRGRLMFKKALRVNGCAQITKSLKTPKLQKILDDVRRRSGVKCKGSSSNNTSNNNTTNNNTTTVVSNGGSTEDTGPEPQRIEHSVPDEAVGGKTLTLKCRAPKKGISKMVVYYRKPGQSDYTAVEMNFVNGYTWKATISPSDVNGAVFQYYIVALGNGGKPIMANGQSGAPNIISITKPKTGTTKVDGEDPLDHGSDNNKKDGGEKIPDDSPKFKKLMLKLGGRFGTGYVSTSMCSYSYVGDPESATSCGGQGVKLVTAGLVTGEMGGELGFHYFISPSLSMGLDAKVGLVFTENTGGEGTSSQAVGFSGLGKILYYPITSGAFRPYFGGVLGGGKMWHSWIVNSEDSGVEVVDAFAHGYVMLGGSLGFLVGSPTVSFYFNVDAFGIFPEQSTFHIDLSAGIAFAF
ncbi:MAG: tetratricopeptide repeat protein [Deltaproteobacteria bacterium]|nr:tetratricopeptide repeat protein [Deltaproteobacteria bacterium]